MSTLADRFVAFNEAASIRGISRSTQYARIATGQISPPRRNGPRLRGWLLSELMAELQQLPAGVPHRPYNLKAQNFQKPPNEWPERPDEKVPQKKKNRQPLD